MEKFKINIPNCPYKCEGLPGYRQYVSSGIYNHNDEFYNQDVPRKSTDMFVFSPREKALEYDYPVYRSHYWTSKAGEDGRIIGAQVESGKYYEYSPTEPGIYQPLLPKEAGFNLQRNVSHYKETPLWIPGRKKLWEGENIHPIIQIPGVQYVDDMKPFVSRSDSPSDRPMLDTYKVLIREGDKERVSFAARYSDPYEGGGNFGHRFWMELGNPKGSDFNSGYILSHEGVYTSYIAKEDKEAFFNKDFRPNMYINPREHFIGEVGSVWLNNIVKSSERFKEYRNDKQSQNLFTLYDYFVNADASGARGIDDVGVILTDLLEKQVHSFGSLINPELLKQFVNFCDKEVLAESNGMPLWVSKYVEYTQTHKNNKGTKINNEATPEKDLLKKIRGMRNNLNPISQEAPNEQA